jgi:simple sugar transport system permease protein
VLAAAFAAIAVGGPTDSAWLGLLAAIVVAVALSQVLAVVTLRFSADFIVAGLGINLLSAGGTLFILERFYNSPGGLRPITFQDIWHIPAGSLSFLPSSGRPSRARASSSVLGLLAVPLCALFLYRTPTGTNLRAAGEDEAAARSAGIRIGAMKALSLAISGVLAGLAGAQLAMDKLHFFLPDMTSGPRLHRPCRDPVRRRPALGHGRCLLPVSAFSERSAIACRPSPSPRNSC